ncbi:putative transporter [Diplodia seriata]|uniref:Putative transporter n=1 Tax=Diplodia seriata TaxID=420778 RepID=A0A1S8B9X2_9PEZI|nr:putative transporter [Diplodia seriata]
MAMDPVTSDQSVSSNSILQEKASEERIENVDEPRHNVGYSVKATKRLLRKMDVRLIPFLALLYLITMWYRRHECGLRMAVFFSAATAAGAFGGLLARGIAEMDGVGGRAGWAWIFILEGILTFIIAITAFFVMHDYPETAKFLDESEKREVTRRLKLDRSSLADEFHVKYFWHALQDWKIWVHMFITIGIYTPLYSISLFMPTIVKGLGRHRFRNKITDETQVPPYVVACVFCIGGGFLADRMKARGVFMIGFCLVALVGFIMLIASKNNSVKYAGVFFAASGIYPNVPQGVAWNGNNIGGSTKRGIGIAMHVGFGNLGGAVASYIYRSTDAPHYHTGHGTLIGFITMSAILSTFMTLYLRKENSRRDAEHKRPEEYTEDEKTREREKGDGATFFRYTV